MDRKVKKDVTRRYEQMLRDCAVDGGYKGRVNCYKCEQCGQVTKTIDVDNGTTPMMIECPYCRGDAASTFYNDMAPNEEVTFEWYRPSLDEVLKMVDDNRLITVNHILYGGLIRRPCSKN